MVKKMTVEEHVKIAKNLRAIQALIVDIAEISKKEIKVSNPISTVLQSMYDKTNRAILKFGLLFARNNLRSDNYWHTPYNDSELK